MNDFNNKLIKTTTREESIAVLLVLFAHGFEWKSGDTVPEPGGDLLSDDGNIFYLRENLITYDSVKKALIKDTDIFINVYQFLRDN